MSGFLIRIPASVRKSMKRIPPPWIDRLWLAIDSLQLNPYTGVAMSGNMQDKRKVKVWPYRIIYRVDKAEKVIVVLEVAHRGSMSYD